jgi:hypothetical protein
MAQSGRAGGGQPQPPNVFNQASNSLQGATKGTLQGMMYQPQMLQNNIQAGQVAGADLSAYTNPYENQVVSQGLQDLDRARMMQANQLDQQAGAAGAFGGSRQALMQSELGRNYLDRSGAMAGGLRQAGFQNAQQMAQQDIQNRMQADMANQSGQMSNQQAGLAGAGLRLGASNQLSDLSNLGFGMGQSINDRMMQQGNMQQLMQQQLMNNAQNQFQGYTGAGAAGLGYMGSALGTAPQESTTTQSKQPGLFDYLTLAMS